MIKKCGFIICALTLGLLFSAAPLMAEAATAQKQQAIASMDVTDATTVLMRHWSASSTEEKDGFLYGFATMLGLNRGWLEKNHPKVYAASPAAKWSAGLDGVTFGELMKTLDQYAVNNPGDGNRSVVSVLWYTYCTPEGKVPGMR